LTTWPAVTAGAAWSGMAWLAGTGGGAWPVGIDEHCAVIRRPSRFFGLQCERLEEAGIRIVHDHEQGCETSVTMTRDKNVLSLWKYTYFN
jgi:hypothetical protein